MSVNPASEPSPQAAAQALVAHLRRNPGDARRSSIELATEFGLSETFVRTVLEGLRPPERKVKEVRRGVSFDFVGRAWAKLRARFDRLTAHPTRFIAASTVIAAIIALALQIGLKRGGINTSPGGVAIDDSLTILVILATFALHMACYFRKKMGRYPLYGGIVVWVLTSVLIMFSIWRAEAGRTDIARAAQVMLGSLGMMVLSLVYAGVGSLAAVFGGWTSMKIRDWEESQMTRQELLERYIQLQARLQSGSDFGPAKLPWTDFAIVQRFQSSPFFWSAMLGFSVSLATVVFFAIFGVNPMQMRGQITSVGDGLILAFIAVLGLVVFLSYVGVGYFAGSVGKAIGCALAMVVGSFLPTLLPLGVYGPEWIASTWGSSVVNGLILAGVSMLGAVGALVQRRALRDRSLQSNDRAALYSEMLRIQWRLGEEQANVCIMVVDAAKSSVMKAEADPLVVEYTFREYQDWLRECGEKVGGRVHSTAGDGAVITFGNCNNALSAADIIQRDLDRFNREVNRLKSPFRLRIGLHVGKVAGNIEDVQFTEIIDIAAHVEKVSPIGAIAVTDDVTNCLPAVPFLPLSVEADGHRIFIVDESPRSEPRIAV